MSKVKDMAADIEELERCGEFLIGLAAVLKEMFSQNTPDEGAITQEEFDNKKAELINII